jgi:hypothetical protein
MGLLAFEPLDAAEGDQTDCVVQLLCMCHTTLQMVRGENIEPQV